MRPEIILALASLFNFLGAMGYAFETLRGRTQPNRVTWILWGVIPLVGAAIGYAEGSTWTLLPILAAGISPLPVVIASYWNKNAYWQLSRFDYLCGFCCLLAIIAWLLIKNPLLGFCFSILADFLAALPTLWKSYRHPESENTFSYITTVLANAVALYFADFTRFTDWGFSLYFVILCSILTVLILRPRISRLFARS